MHSIDLLGVRVDDVTMAETVAHIAEFIRTPRAECRQIATVNPEFIITARHNPEFARVLATSDLNLPDGANLVRAARFLNKPLRARVAGSDLIWHLAAYAAEQGWKIFLLGAQSGVAEQAAANLRARYPSLPIAGTFAGSPSPNEEETIVERVNASSAALLCVAYGAPAQDFWIARNCARLHTRVALGVGGSFDFVAGRIPRAPAWMQHVGLEWLFRLAREPWRIRRQLRLAEFVWLVLRARFGKE